MNLRFSAGEMIKMFGATYRTLDIRSAAVKQGDKWANVYAVIRLTYEQPAVAAERLRRLERDHGAVRTESFRILLGLRPFSELGEFWEDLALGRLCVGGEEVRLAKPLGVILEQERAYLHDNYSEIRPFDSCRWPVAHYRLVPYGSSMLIDDALAREAARLGYSDADEAANLLCEINIRAGQSNGHHFWLSAPVFASIQDVRASLKERRMEVSILRHRKLSTLKGMAIYSRPRTFAGEPPKFRVSIEKFSDGGGTADLHSASASVRLLKVGEDDSVEVKLLQPDLGELHSRVSWSFRELLRPS